MVGWGTMGFQDRLLSEWSFILTEVGEQDLLGSISLIDNVDLGPTSRARIRNRVAVTREPKVTAGLGVASISIMACREAVLPWANDSLSSSLQISHSRLAAIHQVT